MPGRIQIPGQVFGEAGGQQADLAQQNGCSLCSQASNEGVTRRSWYMEFTDTDIYQQRQYITEKILHVFRGPISLEWQQRLPNLVRRLEKALFQEATSKEEYMNLNTLERRLTSLMHLFQRNRNQNVSHHDPHFGPTILIPEQSGNASAMIAAPGQVFGEDGGQQADLAQQNGSSLSSQASNLGGTRRSWHMEFTDTDIYQLRQYITEKILHVFRGPISLEWQQPLPNLVRRLDEALFMEAASKEEYINLNTLERRLTSLMQRFQRNRNQNVSHRDPHVGTMILTPELQQSGNASAMIPAPGTDISTVNGHGTSNMVPNTVGM